jgi:uncharacterized protein HemX
MSLDPISTPAPAPAPAYVPAAPAPVRPVGHQLALALTLLALTVAVFLGTQIGNAAQQKKMLTWQIETSEKQIANAKENSKLLGELITNQETSVKQSSEIQAQYQKLLDDLVKLSEDDDDAKRVVEKWFKPRAAAAGSSPK